MQAAQIFVCTGCTAPPGGDPNFINPANINVGFAGNHTAVAPLLILVGVPNGGAAPTLSLHGGLTAAGAGTYYGLNTATSGGTSGVLEGTLTGAGGGNQNAYATAGLTTGAGGGASESFVNWTLPTYPGGPNPNAGATSFGIYAYAINTALSNTPANIDLTGNNLNDFVIGYACDVMGPTCSNGNINETPFTNAGLTTSGTPTPPPPPVPEPASLVLLGSALTALGLIRRRRQSA